MSTNLLVELLQQYRLRLQGRTVDSPTTPKTFTAHPAKQKQWKPTTLHVQKEGDTFCHDGNHPLFVCSLHSQVSGGLGVKVCTNCLSYNYLSRDCPSRMSCRVCGNRHHSLLHRQLSSTHTIEDATECQPATNGV